MKDLIISDPHLGNVKNMSTLDAAGMNSRFILRCKAFKNILDLGIKERCENLIITGDLFDSRGKIEIEVINTVINIFNEYTEEFKHIIFLTGNHDTTINNSDVFNSLNVLLNNNNIAVVQDCKIQPFANGCRYHFISYKPTVELFKASLETCERNLSSKFNILFIHQKINGSEHNGSILKSQIIPSMFNKFDIVLCGDIHKPQKIGKVNILGAPYHMDFGDNGDRYVYIFNRETFKLKSINVSSLHPKFYTVGSIKEVKNSTDFYRTIGESTELKNVKLIKKVPINTNVRTTSKKPADLIKTYCTNVNRKDMLSVGLKIYNSEAK